MDCHRLLALLLPLSLTLPAQAQSQPAKPKKPPAKPPAAAPKTPDAPAPKTEPAPRVAPTFASLHVGADELPKDWKFGEGLACISPQPRSLLEDDIYSQILPKAKHQDFQTIVGAATTGSILYFDWGDKIPDAVEEFVPALLFGEKEQSTKQHPEMLVRVGGVLVILSFPLDSAERGWAIDRLRTRFGLRIGVNMDPALKPVFAKLLAAENEGGDAKAGLAFAAEHASDVARSSFASFIEGELATGLEEWERARKAYAQAIELDATTDPFPGDGIAWAARDGLGTAFWGLKKYDDAIRELTTAAKVAADLKRPTDQAHCLYNLACSQALSGKGDAALATLKESLALDPTQKEHAAKDDDFASIRARPEFQALVK